MPADIRSFFGGGAAKAAPTKKDDEVRLRLTQSILLPAYFFHIPFPQLFHFQSLYNLSSCTITLTSLSISQCLAADLPP